MYLDVTYSAKVHDIETVDNLIVDACGGKQPEGSGCYIPTMDRDMTFDFGDDFKGLDEAIKRLRALSPELGIKATRSE